MTKDRVEDLLLQARRNIDLGHREEALVLIKKALQEDPGEMVITEVILSMERSGESAGRKTGRSLDERNNADNMDPKLEKAFRLSDEALAAGDEAKALAYLKKALQLFPDEPEAAKKLELLKLRIRAENLVQIGLNKLAEGDLQKAVAASRKAFELMPDTDGLADLINSIEESESTAVIQDTTEPEAEVSPQPAIPDGGAMLWADRIRAAVKEDRFEEAGRMVAEAVRNHPGDPLLDSFHTKLTRLGFVD
jgi:tetratricopeptide (TPR) repeat protein